MQGYGLGGLGWAALPSRSPPGIFRGYGSVADFGFRLQAEVPERMRGRRRCRFGGVLCCLSMKEEEKENEGKRMFIFGMGYTALAVAACLQTENWCVSGTCRTKEKEEALKLRGFDAFQFNPDNDGEDLKEDGLRTLRSATHLLSSVPPVGDFDKDPVLTGHYKDLVQGAELGELRWIGVLSSTGVYGDHEGAWVNEETEVKPIDRRASARVEAERSWLQLGKETGISVQIFRLGGIYGPGRSAWETVMRTSQLSARQKMREGRQYTSRVHVADICQVILASIRRPSSGIFNVVDDDPSPRYVVMDFARRLRDGFDPQSIEHTDLEAVHPPVAHTSGGKRVVNQRVKEELKVKLLYPSYVEGLKAISAGDFPFRKIV